MKIKVNENENFKRRFKNIPIPVEIIVVVVGTSVTYFANFHTKYKIAIVGKVPKG